MSVTSKILACAATLTLVGGVAAATARPAQAATRSCGPECINLFSEANPNSLIDDPSGGQDTGTALVTYPASGGYPWEDFTVESAEPVSDFYEAGIVSEAVAEHYGCDAGIDFTTCPAGSVNDYTFEIQYTPYGAPTGECIGIGSDAAQGTVVSLQPCGVNNHTLWIASLSWLQNFSPAPLIAASDSDFTAPYVLTDDGVVNGLPFEHQLETANQVTNAAGQVSSSQLWGATTGILPVSPLTFGTTSLPTATDTEAYTATLAAYGGQLTYTWSVTAGSLPPGLTLDASTGVISGTPTAYGTYDFTVSVTDTPFPPESGLPGYAGATVSQALSIVVKPAPLVITTTTLPAATGGTAYSATLAATGGITPYTWSVTAGSLPPGLSLNPSTGVISGTPDVAGTYSFTVTVTDSQSPAATASQALSISVSGPVITGIRPSSGPVYGDTPVIITGTGLSCPAGAVGCHVTVTFGGKPAFVAFTRPGEIGVISPPNGASGTVTVTVTVNGVSSQATPASQFTYTGFPF